MINICTENSNTVTTIPTIMDGDIKANLSYSLIPETGRTVPAVYGIGVELRTECGQLIKTKITDAFTSDYSFAKQMLEFAAEHKVGPYSIEDVIEDTCDQLLLTHKQQSTASAMHKQVSGS